MAASRICEEHHAVRLDHRVVAGDHLLLRDIKDLLHHINLVADPVHDRRDQVEPRPERARIPAEALDRVLVALRHRPDSERDVDDREGQQRHDENRKPFHDPTLLRVIR